MCQQPSQLDHGESHRKWMGTVRYQITAYGENPAWEKQYCAISTDDTVDPHSGEKQTHILTEANKNINH